MEDGWDARNAIWTHWVGTPRPAGVLNHLTADQPPDVTGWPRNPTLLTPDQEIIPKIVVGKDGRPCTPGGMIVQHSPLMVIPSCKPQQEVSP